MIISHPHFDQNFVEMMKQRGRSISIPKLIGYWKGYGQDNYPDPHDFINNDMDEEEKRIIVDYLKSGKYFMGYMGTSECRICHCRNGATELTDGEFVWPVGLAHYIEEHNVQLDQEFVKHVKEKVNG